jgi:hypothetical protein
MKSSKESKQEGDSDEDFISRAKPQAEVAGIVAASCQTRTIERMCGESDGPESNFGTIKVELAAAGSQKED